MQEFSSYIESNLVDDGRLLVAFDFYRNGKKIDLEKLFSDLDFEKLKKYLAQQFSARMEVYFEAEYQRCLKVFTSEMIKAASRRAYETSNTSRVGIEV